MRGPFTAVLLAILAALSLGVTQPEFDCTARKLAYKQAAVLMTNTSLSHGLSHVSAHCSACVCSARCSAGCGCVLHVRGY